MTKVSFTTMSTPGYTGIQAIKMAAQYGYQGVDLRVSEKMGELTLDSTQTQINELRDMFQSEGIEPSSLLCYNETGNEESGSWDRMRESIVRNLEIANKLGTSVIRIVSGDPQKFLKEEDFLQSMAETVHTALEQDGSKVVALLQNHSHRCNALQCIRAVELAKHPRFGLFFSPDHCIRMGEDLEKLYSVVKPYTGALFMADIKTVQSVEKEQHVLPGQGEMNLKAAYHAVGGSDFDGWISFKWEKLWNPEIEGPEVALPYFIRYFHEVIQAK